MRVAIGVIFVSLLGGSLNASAVTAADNTAAYSTPNLGGGSLAAANTRQDATNVARADRRLASLDPSQIVYSQFPSYSQGLTQTPGTQAALVDLSNSSRLFPRQNLQPAKLHHARTLEDFLLMGFVALTLIAYQLRKKHRFLRPHPFSY